MNNIHLSILGSAPFINILNELEFSNSLNPFVMVVGVKGLVKYKYNF